jgi:hypothetical protein
MRAGFAVDEEPLRETVLRAYQETRGATGAPKAVLDAVRQFLSGAPGGKSAPDRYWFEEDPPASIASFVEDLDGAAPGLARQVLDPLLAAVVKMEKNRGRELVPNVAMLVSSLSGAVSVKTGLDETLAGAALSAAILGLSRLGSDPFTGVLERKETPPESRP